MDYRELISALIGGSEYLKKNYKILDNLNIFPIPDGDTGTNMTATYLAGTNSLKVEITREKVSSINDICRIMNTALLHESRGNSGFIISRFFHGFFEVIGDHENINTADITEAFKNGLFIVKSALLAPVEGTMVTIISAISQKMNDLVKSNPGYDASDFLDSAVKRAREVLYKTPEMLPVLARAGVVDSGALGFIFIIRGMVAGLNGKSPIFENENEYRFKPVEGIPNPEPDKHMFKYCTEIVLKKSLHKPIRGISSYLKARGDSIAFLDNEYFKLHIHTDNPEEIIDYLSTLGKVEKTKIDDMYEQVSLVSLNDDEDSGCAILSFIPGSGFAEVFAALGVNNYILYKNELPSTGEIIKELELIKDNNIIILPNNSNILPVVLLAKDESDKNISVIPTKDVVQGITSTYGYSENENIQTNVANMRECMDLAAGLFVYRSISDTVYDGMEIKKNDFFIVQDKTVTTSCSNLLEAVLYVISKNNPEELSNISFYCGETFDRTVLPGIYKGISELNELIEIEELYGGQLREELIILLE